MSVYKRGRFWYYNFQHHGKRYNGCNEPDYTTNSGKDPEYKGLQSGGAMV